MKRLLALLLATTLASPAHADAMASYALELELHQVTLMARLNGIPIGAATPRTWPSVVFYLETLLHDGDNDLVLETATQADDGSAYLDLTAPAADPSGFDKGPELALIQCRTPVTPPLPPCKPTETTRLTIHRDHAPDLLLWHADPATPDPTTLAAALAETRATLLAAARAHDWTRLFFGNPTRQHDILAAGGSGQDQAEKMAAYLQAAEAAHPGRIAALPPATPADLLITQLPRNLVLITRKDGRPILRIQVGDGSIPGTPVTDQNPDDFGDYAERWMTGVVDQTFVIYGRLGPEWTWLR